jgi:hypothetical protein
MHVRGRTTIGVVIVSVVVTVIIIGLAAATGYLYWQNQQLRSNVAQYSDLKKKYDDLQAVSPQGVTGLNDAERVVKQLNLIAELPQNEIPTMIPIDDKEKVKTVDFFKNAQPGDYVLVYPQTKFAVLYRPSTYKIINMGPQTFTVGTH